MFINITMYKEKVLTLRRFRQKCLKNYFFLFFLTEGGVVKTLINNNKYDETIISKQ